MTKANLEDEVSICSICIENLDNYTRPCGLLSGPPLTKELPCSPQFHEKCINECIFQIYYICVIIICYTRFGLKLGL